jgi:hypothetical protein
MKSITYNSKMISIPFLNITLITFRYLARKKWIAFKLNKNWMFLMIEIRIRMRNKLKTFFLSKTLKTLSQLRSKAIIAMMILIKKRIAVRKMTRMR